MVILVKLFAIAIVVLGVIFLLSPKALKQYLSFWTKRKNFYLAGILSILFSVVFLLAASQCKLAVVLIIMGILSLIKGIWLFVIGPKGMVAMGNWWLERDTKVLRLIAPFILAFGILLIYSA